MAVMYGRRRVCKTTLVNEFCKDKKTIFCVGIESSEKENRKAFSAALWQPGHNLTPIFFYQIGRWWGGNSHTKGQEAQV